MKPPLSENDARRARSRALASVIVDAPRRVQRFVVPEDGVHRASSRVRHVTWWKELASLWWREILGTGRRRIAVGLLAIQLVAVVALLALPQFHVRRVNVVGTQYLTRQDILAVAHVPSSSIFTIDTSAIQNRLNSAAWIESSTVTTALPNTVTIRIHEWPTALRLVRQGKDYLVSESGAIIEASTQAWSAYQAKPVVIDDRSVLARTISGQDLFNDHQLVSFMNSASAMFPAVLGTHIIAFEWQSDGVLAIWTSSGFSVVLGHMDTSTALHTLASQMEDLVSLKTELSYASPTFGYINVENPQQVAVGGTPGIPARIQQDLLNAAQPPRHGVVSTAAASNLPRGLVQAGGSIPAASKSAAAGSAASQGSTTAPKPTAAVPAATPKVTYITIPQG